MPRAQTLMVEVIILMGTGRRYVTKSDSTPLKTEPVVWLVFGGKGAVGHVCVSCGSLNWL